MSLSKRGSRLGVVCALVILTGCGGGGGGGKKAAPPLQPSVVMTGSWQIHSTVVAASGCSGEAVGDQHTSTFHMSQDGVNVTAFSEADGDWLTLGTMNGLILQVAISSTADGSTTGSLAIDGSGDMFSGRIVHVKPDGCRKTEDVFGIRLPSVVMTGSWQIESTVVAASGCSGTAVGYQETSTFSMSQDGINVTIFSESDGEWLTLGTIQGLLLEVALSSPVDGSITGFLTIDGSGDMFSGRIVQVKPDGCRTTEDIFGIRTTSEPPAPTVLPACAVAEVSVGAYAASGSTVGEVDEFTLPCSYSVLTGPDIGYLFTAPATGYYVFDTVGSGFDTQIAVLTADCQTVLACNEDISFTLFQSATEAFLEAGAQVIVVIDGFGGQAGDYVLNIAAQ
ncbi:MAG: hypothetical protein ACKVX7_16940 [Planctomycetota bacterium]